MKRYIRLMLLISLVILISTIVPNVALAVNEPGFVTITGDLVTPTNQDLILTITISDDLSGIKELVLPNSSKTSALTSTYTISANGTYNFKAIDNAGNETDAQLVVTNIHKIPPVITVGSYDTNWTNEDITVTVGATTTADNKTIVLNKNSHTFTENGTFEFIAEDAYGNVAKQTVTITNIDKTSPNTPKAILLAESTANIKAEATPADVGSGVESILWNVDGVDEADWVTDFILNDTGLIPNKQYTYKYKAKDIVGNESGYSDVESAYTLALNPTKLTLLDYTSSTIKLGIESNSGNDVIPDSRITIKEASTGIIKGQSDWTKDNIIEITGLEPSKLYDVYVDTRNEDGIVNGEIKVPSTTDGIEFVDSDGNPVTDVKTNKTPELDLDESLDIGGIVSDKEPFNNLDVIGSIDDEDENATIKIKYTVSKDGVDIPGHIDKQLGEDIESNGGVIDFNEKLVILSDLPEGELEIKIWLESDRSGKSAESIFKIIVDKTSPTNKDIEVIEVTEDKISIKGESTDAVAGIPTNYLMWNLNGEEQAWSDKDIISHEGLTPNTEYNYKYKSIDKVGNESVWSNEFNIYTLALPPINITYLEVGQTSLTVNWDSNGNPNYTIYEVERKLSSQGDEAFTKVNETTELSFIDTSLNKGESYTYRVRAINGDGESTSYEAGNSVITIPEAPIIKEAIAIKDDEITKSIIVSWDGIDGATKYALYVMDEGEYVLLSSEITELTYTHSNLVPNREYEYYLQAGNENGFSENSGGISLYTQALDPESVTLVGTTINSIELRINDKENNHNTPEWMVELVDEDDNIIDTRHFSDVAEVIFNTNIEEGKLYTITITTRNSDGNVVNDKITLSHDTNPPLVDLDGNPITGGKIATNTKPNITIDTEVKNYFISENDGFNSFKLVGSINDIDNDKVTVTASIYSNGENTTKSAIVVNGLGDFELEWLGNELAEGSYTDIEITASDNRGGVDKVIFTGTLIVDKTKPVTTLLGSDVQIIIDEPYEELGVDSVTDDISIIPIENVVITTDLDIHTEGLYEVRYSVLDEAGNETVVIRKVEVVNPYKDLLDDVIIDGIQPNEDGIITDGEKTITLPELTENQFFKVTVTDLDTSEILINNEVSRGGVDNTISFDTKQGHTYKIFLEIYNKVGDEFKERGTKEIIFTVDDITPPDFTGIYVLNGVLHQLGADNYKLNLNPYSFELNGKIDDILISNEGSFKVTIKVTGDTVEEITFNPDNSFNVKIGDKVLILLRDAWNNISYTEVTIKSLNEVIAGEVPDDIKKQIDNNNYVPGIYYPIERPSDNDNSSDNTTNNSNNIINKEGTKTSATEGVSVDKDGNIVLGDDTKSASLELTDTTTGDKYQIEIQVSNGTDDFYNQQPLNIAYAIKNSSETELAAFLREGYEIISVNSDVAEFVDGKLITKGKGVGEILIKAPDDSVVSQRFKVEDKNDDTNLYTDINGHWAENHINKVTTLGYFEGYEDNTFRPNNNVTRAEYVTALNRLMVLNKDDFIKDRTLYPILNLQEDKWYFYNLADYSTEHSVFEMLYVFEDRDYDKVITREEAAFVLTTKLELLFDDLGYKDIKDTKYKQEIITAKVNQIMIGFPDGSFKPVSGLTRAELAVIMERLIK